MTEITPEGRELAAKLANAEFGENARVFVSCDMESGVHLALARLATDHLALKAEHEKAVADLRRIDEVAVDNRWIHDDVMQPTALVAAIAAKYRETDPLVEAVRAAFTAAGCWPGDDGLAVFVAELSKRGIELARVQS